MDAFHKLSPPRTQHDDDILDHLIRMTNQTCLIALNKTLTHIKPNEPLHKRSSKVSLIAHRIVRAMYEVKSTL